MDGVTPANPARLRMRVARPLETNNECTSMLLNGVLDWSWWQLTIAGLLLTHVTIAAVTIFLHRAQAHRALTLHPLVSHFFRFWLWLTTGMVTRQWVAVHRLHHARCETPEDPHSPQVLGLRKVLAEGAELYRAKAADPAVVERYGHGTPDDWLERRLYARFPYGGISLLLVLNLLLFGIPGVALWAIQMIWIPFWAAGVINGVGHYWGYRNYDAPDASRNILPWGILIGGEELHNNHHAFPSSARLSSKWWEFDIGWLYIRLLALLGLAEVRRVAPEPAIVPDKEQIDLDTVRAVIRNRMHVMARYASDVVKPVVRNEFCRSAAHCRRRVRRIRRLLEHDESRLAPDARERLRKLLADSQALETVYRYRQQLKNVWGQSAASQEALVRSLREWCHSAEETGIQALQDFARHLRGYSLQAAG